MVTSARPQHKASVQASGGGGPAVSTVVSCATPAPGQLSQERVGRSEPGYAAGVSMQDWDCLFAGLVDTLDRNAADWLADMPELPPPGRATRARRNLEECISGLRQLRATLRVDAHHRQALSIQTVDVQPALGAAFSVAAPARDGALHDSVTNLASRADFCARLREALDPSAPSSRSAALFHISLDNLQAVTDLHGQAVGDEMSRIVGGRLTHSVRAEDAICQYTSDQLVCMFYTAPLREQLGHLACKLIDAVCAPLTIGRLRLSARASVGIALWPLDGVDAQTLLRRAELAMTRAKGARSGYVFFREDAAVD